MTEFRGLTIRLGADARPLNSALSSISRSASAAQKQMNAIGKALKGDAQNAGLMSSRIEVAEDRLRLMARSATITSSAIRQAAGEQVHFNTLVGTSSGKMEAVASAVRDTFSATQRLRAEETHINEELQLIYDAIKKAYAEELQLADSTLKADEAFERADKHVKSLQRKMSLTGKSAAEAATEMRNLVRGVASVKTIWDAFDLGKADNAADKLVYTFTNLRQASRAVGQDLKEMNKVASFNEMRIKAAMFESEMRSAAREAVHLRTELYLIGSSEALPNAVRDAKSLDNVLEAVTAEAREMREIARTIPNNIEAAVEAARASKAQTEVIEEKLEKVRAVLKEIRSNPAFDEQKARMMNAALAVEKLEGEYADLMAKMKMAQEKLEALNAEMKEFSRLGYLKPGRSLDELQNEIVQTKNHMDGLGKKIDVVDGKLKEATLYRTFQKGEQELHKFSAELTAIGQKTSVFHKLNNAALNATRALRTMGYGLYSTVTPALMMLGRYAIQAARDIDAAYRDMRKTVNGTEEQFEHLKQAAIEFSTTHITSAQQILEIESIGGQLGIAAENLEGFSNVVSNLDIATNMDAETIATNIGQLSNIMWDIKQHKNDPKEYQQAITSFSDSLVRLGNNSAAQESNIMKVMMRLASLGSISGFTTDQLLAISTAIAATGQGAEAAGTAISRTFSQIESAVSVGGDTLETWAGVAQMSAEEFAEAWKNDPVVAFQSFINGLKAIDDAGDSVETTLKSLKINSVRQKQALMGLTTTTDVLSESLVMSKDAWNGLSTRMKDGMYERAGDAAREAERKSEGFSGTLGKMTNNAKSLAMELASGAEPILKDLSDTFQSLTKTVSAMSDSTKTDIVGWGIAIASIGPAAVGIGAVTNVLAQLGRFAERQLGKSVFPKLASQMIEMGDASSKAGKSFGGFKAALAGLNVGTLLGIAAAIAGIAFVAKMVYDDFERTANATTRFKDAIGDMPSIANTWKGVETLSDGLSDLNVNMQEVMTNNIKLADAIGKKNKESQAEIDLLEDSVHVLRDYAGKTDLSASELGKLRAAIDLVNEKCRTHYELVEGTAGVIRDENGALVDSVDAITEHIRAKQRLIEADAAEANYNAAREQHVENLKNLAARQREYNQALDQIQDPSKYGLTAEAAEAQYEYASKRLEEAKMMAQNTEDEIERDAARLGDIMSGQFLDSNWEAIFSSYFDDAGAAFANFSTAVKNAGIDTEKLNALTTDQIIQIVEGWSRGEESLVSLLEQAGIKVQTFESVITGAMQDAGLSFEDLAKTFDMSTSDLAGKLSEAGISADDMANAIKNDFANLVEQAGGDVDKLIASIIELNSTPANVEVDTSALTDAEAEAEDFDGETYSADAELNADQVEETFDEIGADVEDYDGSTYNATAALNTNPAINALDSLISRLNNYANSTWTATVSSVGNARGGISSIPVNASGGINGIITRATLTNVGWVGENGDEALIHMRHAGGAIIPLSNRQHVRPFAQAVAAEMHPYTGYQTQSQVTYNINVTAGSDGEDIARTIAHAIRQQDLMMGRR